jgi:hypothetical protein
MEYIADTDLPTVDATFWFIQYHYTINMLDPLASSTPLENVLLMLPGITVAFSSNNLEEPSVT